MAQIFRKKDQSDLVCHECPSEAVSVCSYERKSFTGCGQPFCGDHGLVANSLQFELGQVKKQEREASNAAQQLSAIISPFAVPNRREAEYFRACSICYSRANNKSSQTETKWKVVDFLLLAGILCAIFFYLFTRGGDSGSGARCDEFGMSEGTQSIIRCKNLGRTLTRDEVMAYLEYRGGKRCRVNSFGPDCKCEDPTWNKFNRATVQCERRPPCSKNEVYLGASSPIVCSAQNFVTPRWRDCPYYQRFIEGECQVVFCPSNFRRTDQGNCENCPLLYEYGSGSLCYLNDLGDGYVPFGSDYGKPCSETGSFYDEFEQLQCPEASLRNSSFRQPCEHHQIFNRKFFGCIRPCPPYYTYNYATKECLKRDCFESGLVLVSDGMCRSCLYSGETASECKTRFELELAESNP